MQYMVESSLYMCMHACVSCSSNVIVNVDSSSTHYTTHDVIHTIQNTEYNIQPAIYILNI